jgi:hypothetical protein
MTGLNRTPRGTLLGATSLLIVVALAIANFAGSGDNGGVGPFLVLSAVSIGVAAVLFMRVVPQAVRPLTGDAGRTGLILAVAALVLVVVFWTGLSFALGVPAVLLGSVAWERASQEDGRRGQSTAAVVLGGLAVLAALAASIFG